MNYTLNQIPFFENLNDSQVILLAGAGGGFDIYSGIPIYFSLKQQGKKVILANFSFTKLSTTTAEEVFPGCYKIEHGSRDLTSRNYFPEQYLKLWLFLQGEEVDFYAFQKTGVNPLKNTYKYLIRKYEVDTIVLVDGGTDSLMFGDEEGLGTPHEDICSMAAVYRTGIKKKYLLSIGFGIDQFHGVSHFRFLENLAELAKEGGYLGLFQVTKEMEEGQRYLEAVKFVNQKMPEMKSIVHNSIVSALEGEYGDHHRTDRTIGSQLWINPLMSIYWCFELGAIIRKIKYYEYIKDVNTMMELDGQLSKYRSKLTNVRSNKGLPI